MKVDFLLYHADNALIIGHRNSEWCGHGPILEQDIAITNIALDLLGQARNFYQYAAVLLNEQNGGSVDEDTLAYHRDAAGFKNSLLTEQPNGHWGITILRQFFFSVYQYYLYQSLQHSNDETIAAIAAKALKEVTYHVKWSSEWVVRLGDGTAGSHEKMEEAVAALWSFTKELFEPADFEAAAWKEGFGVDLPYIKQQWQTRVKEIFAKATLDCPTSTNGVAGGKQGVHSTDLAEILLEMQYLQRLHPNATW